MNKIKICIVEDDYAFLFLFKELVKTVSTNIEVLSFADGKQAAEFFDREAANAELLPAVIFLDLNMPVMDGWQFLEAFEKLQSKLKRRIPVYVLSSSISEKDLARSKENALVNSFIEKPIEASRIEGILAEFGFKGE